jgi:tetratricopeptide (TPR) repeat protein
VRGARRWAATLPSRAALLQRAVACAPGHLPLWLSLAAVLRTLGLRGEELAALEHALALNPTHLIVLLQKAAVLDLMHQPRAAASIYGNALQTLAPGVPGCRRRSMPMWRTPELAWRKMQSKLAAVTR